MARLFRAIIICIKPKGRIYEKSTVFIDDLPMILSACATKCESEPIVEENHKLIVPPNFGQMPK